MTTFEKNYDELSFTDDFMFSKILRNNEDICKELVELLIEKKISKIIRIDKEKFAKETIDGKGVRLDICIEGEKDIYNIEMQNSQHRNIAKRARYYQSMLDVEFMEQGGEYEDLKNGYIIFINDFDLFKQGRIKYTFKNLCLENTELEMGDETTKIFVNTRGNCDKIKPEMRDFVTYLVNGIPTNEFTKKIDAEIVKARTNSRWRGEFMTVHEHYKIGCEKAQAKGEKIGIAKGEKLGIIKTIDNMMKKSLTLEEACNMAEISIEEYEKAKKSIEEG